MQNQEGAVAASLRVRSAPGPGMLASAWRYRRFILSSIEVEFRGRFARSRMGLLWMVAQPLAQVAIFSFVLSGLLSMRMPGNAGPYAYVIYLMAGSLSWSLFSEIVTRCAPVFVDNAALIRKVSFPRVTLPIIVTGVALVNNLALFVVIALAAMLLGFPPSAAWLWLLPMTMLTAALAAALGVIVGTLNVFVRDVGQSVPVVLQVVFWLTPIVYFQDVLPKTYAHWLDLNPLTHVVTAYQGIFLLARGPEWSTLVPVAGLAAVLLVAGLGLFRRASGEMPDVL